MLAPFGLRVVGSASGRREVVSLDKATALYAAADPLVRPEIPAFLSAFAYPIDLKHLIERTQSAAGYVGPIAVPSLNFDLDRPDLTDALRDARRLVARVQERWRLDGNDLVVAFSGSKGFHVAIPVEGIPLAGDNHTVARRLAVRVADEVGIRIDEGVYLPTQLWRAPNSRHPRTGLFKIRIDADDLLHISTDGVLGLAREPIPFDPPPRTQHTLLLREWADVAGEVRADALRAADERRVQGDGTEGGKINALTWAVVREGAEPGDRHRLLFSCAANLAEFATLDDLVVALLTPVGLDMGLPPHEVARQIQTGIAHARKRS